ncbi:MAG: monofunctional biosynthetic peptidoglycan transglycosylase [Flavobacteriaceae bacterium]|nr:monofunctional biosynthetic peptidoglycan transglycosylase [Flavobacteriaceae bacterium]
MLKRLARMVLRCLLWFLVLSVAWVLLYKFVPVPYTSLMAIRTAQGGPDTQHDWVSIENISASMQLAVICAEDQRFLDHNGFDYNAIKAAYERNRKGNTLRGGSTISQQTAKNVFLWPGRSYVRKGFEAYFTFLIELFWSKERILEVYLNSVEMGEGIYGVEAAAQHWFRKSAEDLTRHEAAAIAAILPNPRKYKANPRTPYLETRKQWVLRQMYNFGSLDFEIRETARN